MANKQTDRNEHRHTFSLILLSEHSLLWVSSVRKHVYLWFILMVTSVVYVCATQEWNHQLHNTDITIKIRRLRRTHTLMQQQIVVTVVEKWACLPSSTTTARVQAAHLRHTKNKGMSTSVVLCSQATCNLTTISTRHTGTSTLHI